MVRGMGSVRNREDYQRLTLGVAEHHGRLGWLPSRVTHNPPEGGPSNPPIYISYWNKEPQNLVLSTKHTFCGE